MATWDVVFVKRTNEKRIVVWTAKKRTKKTLSNLINKFVDNRSIIHTYCCRGFIDAENYVAQHRTVDHSISFVNSDNIDTNTIEGNYTAVKAFIPKRYR
ncbi:hypothetical protein COBT_002306, partial [Conglomerata obtusa]